MIVRDSRRFSIEKYWELCAQIKSPLITQDVIYLQTKVLVVLQHLSFLSRFENVQEFKFAISIADFCKGPRHMTEISKPSHCTAHSHVFTFKGLHISRSKGCYYHIAAPDLDVSTWSLVLLYRPDTATELFVSCAGFVLSFSASVICH